MHSTLLGLEVGFLNESVQEERISNLQEQVKLTGIVLENLLAPPESHCIVLILKTHSEILPPYRRRNLMNRLH